MNAFTTTSVAAPAPTPGFEDLQNACRADIAEIGGKAAFGMRAARSDSAITLLMLIAREARHATSADYPASQLIRTRGTLEMLLEGARHLERIQRDG